MLLIEYSEVLDDYHIFKYETFEFKIFIDNSGEKFVFP